jgi:hypothetical protein
MTAQRKQHSFKLELAALLVGMTLSVLAAWIIAAVMH